MPGAAAVLLGTAGRCAGSVTGTEVLMVVPWAVFGACVVLIWFRLRTARRRLPGPRRRGQHPGQ